MNVGELFAGFLVSSSDGSSSGGSCFQSFNELLKVDGKMADEMKDASARMAVANQHTAEIAKALQWRVDERGGKV